MIDKENKWAAERRINSDIELIYAKLDKFDIILEKINKRLDHIEKQLDLSRHFED